MAKQQKPTDQPQQEASAYSQDEAILLRYPDNGKVSAVSDLQVNNNLLRIVDVEPTQTNRASFMKKTSSNALATFFNQLWAHLQNPSLMPEIYIVPFSKVPDVASDLRKLLRMLPRAVRLWRCRSPHPSRASGAVGAYAPTAAGAGSRTGHSRRPHPGRYGRGV